MKLTQALKTFLIDNCGVTKDAGDDDFEKAVGVALAKGTLTPAQLVELTETEETKEANAVVDALSGISKGIEALLAKQEGGSGDAAGSGTATATADPPEGGDKAAGGVPGGDKDTRPDWQKGWSKVMGGNLPTDVRVKGAWEQYSTTKTALLYPDETKGGKKHPNAGRPVVDFSERGRAIDVPSELDKAVIGAFCKHLAATAKSGGSRTIGLSLMPQHDKELLYYALENYDWAGASDGGMRADIKGRLTPQQQKALIDDATSGGLEAAPIVFDDDVIQTPLLHGELFPLVKVVPLDRGRRVEGVSTGTVTGSWGGVDDTAISLFNTASYVSAFDTTIYRWEGAIRIGLDFLSDTPIDFGAHVSAQYGERLLEDLDDVIATGNGTTQPEGVMNKSGISSVAFGGANSIGNIESLRYGVAKAEHRSNVAASAVFCGTETSFQRWRALPVGASDARRLFGNDHFGTGGGIYHIADARFAINESLTNAQIFYCVMARYRMYRRRGLTMRTSTEGDTLIRNNEMLMVAMSRWGGQLERAAVGAITTTAPA